MKITAEARSDQWNADDFIAGPRTFTIAGVKAGTAEAKYDIELVEGQGRVWRPPLTVLRLLLSAWGDEASVWIGRRVTLHRDATVSMNKSRVGGIRVSHMSDLPDGQPLTAQLTTSRGRRAPFTVQPLVEAPSAPSAPTPAQVAASTDEGELRGWWVHVGLRDLITARVNELKAEPAQTEIDA